MPNLVPRPALERVMQFLTRGAADVAPEEAKVISAIESGASWPGFRAVRDIAQPFNYPERPTTFGWHLDPSPSGAQALAYLRSRREAFPERWGAQSGIVPVMYNPRGMRRADSDMQANNLEALLQRYGLMDDYRAQFLASDDVAFPQERYLVSKGINAVVYPNDVEGFAPSARWAERALHSANVVINPSISVMEPTSLRKVSKRCGGLVKD